MCVFYWSSEGGTAASETLVLFATYAEVIATVESQISVWTMDSETLVPIAASAYDVAMVESGTSLTWSLLLTTNQNNTHCLIFLLTIGQHCH